MKELKNSLNIPIEILQFNKVTNNQKFILATIYQLLKNEYEISISINRISELSSCSYSTVKNSLQIFKKYNLIRFYLDKDINEYNIKIDNSVLRPYYLNLEELKKLEKQKRKDKEFYSLHIDYTILHNKALSPTDKITLAYLSSFSKKNKECFTKTKNICTILGLNIREYKKSIAKLKKLDLIDSEITRKNNRISGKKIKSDLEKIEKFYVENINTIKQLEIDRATIEKIETIEKVSVNNVESINAENIENANFINVNRISDSLLETFSREQLYKLYKENQKESERIKHYINRMVNNNDN